MLAKFTPSRIFNDNAAVMSQSISADSAKSANNEPANNEPANNEPASNRPGTSGPIPGMSASNPFAKMLTKAFAETLATEQNKEKN